MGVLATLAAALFPDANPDGSPHAPLMADMRQFAGSIDDAIPNAQDLTSLRQHVDATAADLDDGLGAVSGSVDALNARVDAQSASVDRAVTAAADASAAAVTASAAAAGFAAALATQAAALYLAPRPGDMPAAFTTDLASGISGVPPNAAQAVSALGGVLRITGALPALATCGLRAIEADRLYKVRTAFQRVTDTAAPTPAAVVFAVAWYGPDRNRLAIPATQIAVVALTIASGLAAYSALLSLNPPDQTNLDNPRVAQVPAGAVYFRPYVQIFGADVVTDLVVIEHADVTDAASVLPPSLDMVLARLSRVEAALNLPAL